MESFKGKPKLTFVGSTDRLSHEQPEEPCSQCGHGCGSNIGHGRIECRGIVYRAKLSNVSVPEWAPYLSFPMEVGFVDVGEIIMDGA